jgi:Pectinacetylesterase
MRRVAAIAIVCLGVLAACSDDSSSSESTLPPSPQTVAESTTAAEQTTVAGTTPVDTTPATSSPSPATDAAPVPAGWEQVTTSGECMCADGSPYSYWIHRADPDKVVFFLQGGGACFDVNSCAFDSGIYKTTTGVGDDPTNLSGIFDFTDARNPLADYSFVFAPYCTGDVHLGTATHVYSPELTIEHKGSINATTALAALATQFPDTAQLVVTGESAGSIPTPLYAGLAHDLLPNAEISVLADGSGAYPDLTALNAGIGALWGTEAAIPPWPENAGLTAATWSIPGLFVQANKHDPEIIFGRHDYAFDQVQQSFLGAVGIPTDDLVTLIDSNETQIEQGGVDLRSYIAPGNSHTVLGRPEFYTETVEGVPLVEWVSNLVRRQPDADVHCKECGT